MSFTVCVSRMLHRQEAEDSARCTDCPRAAQGSNVLVKSDRREPAPQCSCDLRLIPGAHGKVGGRSPLHRIVLMTSTHELWLSCTRPHMACMHTHTRMIYFFND